MKTLILAAVEEHGEPAIHPYWVGVIALGLLLAMLLFALSFGKGRPHS